MAKKESGEITLLEQMEFLSNIEQHSQHAQLMESLKAIKLISKKDSAEYFENQWDMLQEKLQTNETKTGGKTYWKQKTIYFLAAASIFGVIVISVLFFNNGFERKISQQNIFYTKKASKSTLVLPDGSKVWLNADTKISYDKSFNNKTREIELNGEAFFDVVHDAGRPFIIHTEKADVKVLGTAFNIRNYKDEDLLETSLIRGKIEVILSGNKENKIVLKPSEKLSITKNVISKQINTPIAEIITLSHVTIQDSMVAETSWINNKTVIIDKPLYEIAAELERQFDIKSIFKSETAKNYRYTIHLEDKSLDQIMEILQLSKKNRL
ncbi:MAG: FecR family protein [Sphingobacteriales bacterium]|nr:FecR family protein [Sphingobacteriales bacterium]